MPFSTKALGVFLGFFLGFISLACHGQALVLGPPLDEKISLREGVEYLEDPDHSLTIDDLLNGDQTWQVQGSEVFQQGYTDSAWWMRFSVGEYDWSNHLISLDSILVEEADVWFLDGTEVLQHHAVGTSRPFANRPIQYHYFVIPFSFAQNKNTAIYVRLQGRATLNTSLSIFPEDTYWAQEAGWTFFFAVHIGGLLVIGIYNFLLFLSTRDSTFFFYCLYIIATTAAALFSDGWVHQLLLKNGYAESPRIVTALYECVYLTTLIFAYYFLNIKSFSRRLAQSFIAVIGLVVCYLAATVTLLPLSIAMMLVSISVLIVYGLCITAGIIGYFKGNRTTAKYYLISWTPLILGILMLTASRVGIFSEPKIGVVGIQLGILLEMVLLSFALANRINREKALRLQERQASIEAQAESKAKSQFLASMSHEIRTPMNGIIGMTHFLEDTSLNSQQKQYIDIIKSSGQALMRVINDVLDFSKISAGKMTLEIIDFDIEETLYDTTAMFFAQAESKNITLKTEIAENTSTLVKGDPTRLQQVLINLLGNALKFTDGGTVTVKVWSEKFEHHDEFTNCQHFLLRFSIADTGIGIASELQATLFDAFNQGDQTTARRFGGTGLGLSICKNLVELMGGELTVESEAGKGSDFQFSIRTQLSDPLYMQKHDEILAPLRPIRVLLLSCVYENEAPIVTHLRKWCSEVTFCNSTADARAHLQADPARYDIFMLDSDNQQTAADLLVDLSAGNNREHLHFVVLLPAQQTNDPLEGQTLPNQVLTLTKPVSARFLRDNLSRLIRRESDKINDENHNVQTFHNIEVLVAEDNAVNQLVISGLLTKLGIKPKVANDGIETLDFYKREHGNIDIIFMDCEMPEMDGYEATRLIRKFESEHNLQPVPIYALSAHAMQEHAQRSNDAGMDGHISKPVELNALAAVLTSLAKNQQDDLYFSQANFN